MNDDLHALGDALERAIALDIATGRNISRLNRHRSTDHTDVIEEDPMFTSDHAPDNQMQAQPRRNV